LRIGPISIVRTLCSLALRLMVGDHLLRNGMCIGVSSGWSGCRMQGPLAREVWATGHCTGFMLQTRFLHNLRSHNDLQDGSQKMQYQLCKFRMDASCKMFSARKYMQTWCLGERRFYHLPSPKPYTSNILHAKSLLLFKWQT